MNKIGGAFLYLFKVAGTVFVGIMTAFISVFVAMLVLVAVGAGMAAVGEEAEVEEVSLSHVYGNEESSHKVAVLHINGLILGSRAEVSPIFDLFSDTGIVYGYEVKDTLRKLEDQEEVKGVILMINSPGGTIYGTKAIVDGVAAYQQAAQKPVISYVSSVAASGGYWVAASGTKVYADYGTALGSIGVISGPFKHYKDVVSESGGFGESVETSGGITTEYITAGKHKDFGNPYRELSDEERETMQASVNDSYEDFLTYVSQRRGVSAATLREDVGAMLYGEKQAIAKKLADERISKEDLYQKFASETGAQGDDYQIMEQSLEPSFFEILSGAQLKHLLGSLIIRGQSMGANSSQPPFVFCGSQSATLVYDGDLAALCQ